MYTLRTVVAPVVVVILALLVVVGIIADVVRNETARVGRYRAVAFEQGKAEGVASCQPCPTPTPELGHCLGTDSP